MQLQGSQAYLNLYGYVGLRLWTDDPVVAVWTGAQDLLVAVCEVARLAALALGCEWHGVWTYNCEGACDCAHGTYFVLVLAGSVQQFAAVGFGLVAVELREVSGVP